MSVWGKHDHRPIETINCTNVMLSVEKLDSVYTILSAFGNCRTSVNANASRFTQIFTVDFDPTGQVGSASVQVKMSSHI